MKLFTKEIEKKLQAQYPLGNKLEEQDIVCKIFNPCGSWTWWLLNQDPDDPDYLWAIVKGTDCEIGSVSKSELEGYKGPLGIGLERDLYFKPVKAIDLWRKLTHA